MRSYGCLDAVNLEEEPAEHDRRYFPTRLARFRFTMKTAGSQAPFALPGFSIGYFYDAEVCLINGAFAACIVMCQLVCEEMLKSPYRFKGDVRIVESKFVRLIDQAQKDGLIASRTARQLNWLRKTRNLISHSKDFSRLESKDWGRVMIMDGYTLDDKRLERKAKRSFQIASDLLKRGAWLGRG